MTDLMQTTLTAPRSVNMALIVGACDEILHVVEEAFDARITVRGDRIVIEGTTVEVQPLTALFADLIKTLEEGRPADADYVRHSIDLLRTAEFARTALRDDILLTYRGRAIRPKTAGQKRYVDAIRDHTITFAIGPAGTGKTYLAMAMAVAALKRKEVGRIILTRPVVEAGENLGFLPGTLAEKVDPYIRPLYDALFDMTDMERATALIENGVIEIAPLAFMRGRTLNDTFIILDEAQNTTPEQMKMALTRLGFGSKIVVTGDVSQIDLPRGESGLVQVRSVLEGIDDIAFCDLSGKDVVRHSLVATIVAAYERAAGKAGSPHGNPHHLRTSRGRPRLPSHSRPGPVRARARGEAHQHGGLHQLCGRYGHGRAERALPRYGRAATDVLSFECDNIDDDITAADGPSCPVYELGDIIVAPDVAARQSTEFGNSFEQEVSLLIVHGLLHLCGYDHIVDEEAEVMEARERELLTAWARARPARCLREPLSA